LDIVGASGAYSALVVCAVGFAGEAHRCQSACRLESAEDARAIRLASSNRGMAECAACTNGAYRRSTSSSASRDARCRHDGHKF
jgi:hypothetical protein